MMGKKYKKSGQIHTNAEEGVITASKFFVFAQLLIGPKKKHIQVGSHSIMIGTTGDHIANNYL
jgi:hypothetical protein